MIEARRDILPNAQKEIWPALVEVRDAFVLYGGTGLALRLGHRISVDFDFFCHDPLDDDRLFALRLLDNAETLQRSEDSLTVSVPTRAGDRIKLSFFGGIDLGRVGTPDQTEDGVAWVASLLDLLAMKLAGARPADIGTGLRGHRRHTGGRRSAGGRAGCRHRAIRSKVSTVGCGQGARLLRRGRCGECRRCNARRPAPPYRFVGRFRSAHRQDKRKSRL